MKTVCKPFILVLLFISLIALISLACNLPINQVEGLTISRNDKNGSVSGNYRTGNQSVEFSVSSDGLATFQTGNGTDAEKLVVDMRDETTATLNWQGTTIDGLGELSAEELQHLNDLLVSRLAPGLSMIPVDAGCQGEEIIDDKQLAALLFPLQMQLKYIISDRTSKAIELIQSSQCYYGLLDEEMAEINTKNVSSILLSVSNPIPVVIGYFPFDETGAIPPSYSQESMGAFACLNPLPLVNVESDAFSSQLYSVNLNGSAPIRDEFGPCQATCRGACGADCTTKNCKYDGRERCEKDEFGNNTGLSSYIHTYTCGVHPACISHDECYDRCNQQLGCGTWDAAYCRHGGYSDLSGTVEPLLNEQYGTQFFCDKITIADESLSDVRGWMKGAGPQPLSQVYEYTDEIVKDNVDLKKCPPPNSEVQEDPPPAVPEPIEQPPAYIKPQLVTAVSPTTWLCGGVDLRITAEFWNVGALGGDEYSMVDIFGNGCNHDVVTEATHWYGTFEGGPNGKFTLYEMDWDCRLIDGEVMSCSGIEWLDEEITLPFEVLNPEAFEDWK